MCAVRSLSSEIYADAVGSLSSEIRMSLASHLGEVCGCSWVLKLRDVSW